MTSAENATFVCSACEAQTTVRTLDWRCDCGGLFDLPLLSIAPAAIDTRQQGVWRYRDWMHGRGYGGMWSSITLGEGNTRCVQAGSRHPKTVVKIEYASPTLSFKDRGATAIVCRAASLGVSDVIADSSGNAGTAIAAYAARANIRCTVFVPEGTSAKKIEQIKAHGAKVEAVGTTRDETAAAAIGAVERRGVFYASHVADPHFYQGTKSYAFELWEAFGDQVETLVLPAGNGTLVLGAFIGFAELLAGGLIEKMPRIIAVQSEQCAPLAARFSGAEESEHCGATLAEGIAIGTPARARQIVDAVRKTGGYFITVSESEIVAARAELAGLGWYVEPTAAVTWAASVKCGLNETAGGKVVVPLCGAGIKASAS